MSDNKYLITVNKVNVAQLPADKLALTSLPETLNSVIEDLAPKGSIDLELVYLLTDSQYEKAIMQLEENSVPYPRQGVASNAAKIINLSDRRKPDPV
jgi:hypothetical protein